MYAGLENANGDYVVIMNVDLQDPPYLLEEMVSSIEQDYDSVATRRVSRRGDPVSGWPSLLCIILMTSGVQFFCTGILGQYLAKTYMEVKRRPIYIVKEKL